MRYRRLIRERANDGEDEASSASTMLKWQAQAGGTTTGLRRNLADESQPSLPETAGKKPRSRERLDIVVSDDNGHNGARMGG